MPTDGLEIIRCPAELRGQALAVVLCDLAPSQRCEVAKLLLDASAPGELAKEPLFIARRGEQLCGAAWGQRQSGNFAVFWPPQLVAGEEAPTERLLAEAVVRELDVTRTDLAQSLLLAPDTETVTVLLHVGFRHLADLLYLSCEASRFPLVEPDSCEVDFEAYAESQRGRLASLIERTYEGTLDCTALDRVRDMDDVINGYQATGVFQPENWMFVQRRPRCRRVAHCGPSARATLGINVHGAGA